MKKKNQSMQMKRQKMIKMIGKFIGSKCRYENKIDEDLTSRN